MQDFVKGQFKPYRALTKIHLGKAGTDVYKDDIIEFDGTTVKILSTELQETEGSFAIPCAQNSILHITSLQQPGKKPISGREWKNAHKK